MDSLPAKLNPHHHKIAVVLLASFLLLGGIALFGLWKGGFFEATFITPATTVSLLVILERPI